MAKYTDLYCNTIVNLKGNLTDLNKQVWGILNVTPDSFYDGGKNKTITDILKSAEKMIAEGADVIDIGAASSRPGAELLSPHAEWQRLKPALAAIKKEFSAIPLSIDTYHSFVANAALNEGADIINDISGGSIDSNMLEIIAKYNVPYVIMHMRGNPQTMQQNCSYNNIVLDVLNELSERIYAAKSYSITNIIIDPGFGFAKTISKNFELLKNLHYFSLFQYPVLVGLSRKSMIYKTLKISANEALCGTVSLNTLAVLKGANILRVHDVKEAKQLIGLINELSI
jgi:dihydropteroate synthase